MPHKFKESGVVPDSIARNKATPATLARPGVMASEWRFRMQAQDTCSVAGCSKDKGPRGMCWMHYSRERRYGSLAPLPPLPTAAERFWALVDKSAGPDGCWPWTGRIERTGYARFYANGRTVAAHRFAYELVVGLIPEGLVLDHVCHSADCHLGSECPHRRCVNPAHLCPVTNRENVLRGASNSARSARATHCAKGHPFDAQNTTVDKRGWRRCLECDRVRSRERYWRTVASSGAGS